ncbi:MAG: hypothetical protein IJI07_06395 [Flexilinea sp.]|nr:hypothetical protein [Flexilinea sp.]
MSKRVFLTGILLPGLFLLLSFLCASAETGEDIIQIAVSYCAVECDSRPIMAEYSDAWLLAPPDEFNQKLMQASFVMAASAFRDNTHDLDQKDFNIRNFFSRAGFSDPRTDDYNRLTSIDTIGSAIAHKKVGDVTLIAVAMSGNNYSNEWLSNFTVSDEQRSQGFNDAAGRVSERIREYISEYALEGELRLWITGYSRAAAVANIAAADATDSGLFAAVYGYTIGTPRTTKDEDAQRFGNIFNVVNPFDPVPLMPFPEWGYKRYGVDLYLPSMETDSAYFVKKVEADQVSQQVTGAQVRFNPQVNAQLHTIMDFLLFYVQSAKSYKENFQSGILSLWESRELGPLLEDLADRVDQAGDITASQFREFYYFLDYLCQVLYSSFRGQKFHPADLYWNPGLSLQENLMHEHYDSAYLSWIFSSDDPEEVYRAVPQYMHYTVLGDVDVELFDGDGNFIERVESSGKISADPADVRAPYFAGSQSSTYLFAERRGGQTFVILPKDQTFSAVVFSRKAQEVRFTLIDYSADAVRADMGYVYYENMEPDGYYGEVIDPSFPESISEDGLTEKSYQATEPWNSDDDYKPSAVMRLENADTFHPAPLSFVTFSGLTLLMVIYILFWSFAGVGAGVKQGVRKVRSIRSERKSALSEPKRAKIETDQTPENQTLKDDSNNEDK